MRHRGNNMTISARKEDEATKAEEANKFATKVANSILHIMGTPKNLHDVQVRQVDNHRYRVNIRTESWTEMETCCAVKGIRIYRSFYVAVNDDGRVVNSCPEIKREH